MPSIREPYQTIRYPHPNFPRPEPCPYTVHVARFNQTYPAFAQTPWLWKEIEKLTQGDHFRKLWKWGAETGNFSYFPKISKFKQKGEIDWSESWVRLKSPKELKRTRADRTGVEMLRRCRWMPPRADTQQYQCHVSMEWDDYQKNGRL
jgi:hypothetical protein